MIKVLLQSILFVCMGVLALPASADINNEDEICLEVQEFQEVAVSQVHLRACAAALGVPSMKEPISLLRKGVA